MIASKMHKDAKKQTIMVEISSNEQLPEIIKAIMEVLRSEKVPMIRSHMPEHQINIYQVGSHKISQYQGLKLENLPSQLQHKLTIFYQNDKTQNLINLPQVPPYRTLLLRQDLEPLYSLEYEIEEVDGKKEGQILICSLLASTMNAQVQESVSLFDQKVDGLSKGKKAQGSLKDTWTNVLYQIPGIGQEKASQISEKFPTYQTLLKDWKEDKTLESMEIQMKGGKKSKLGSTIANRIYRLFFSPNFNDLLN